MVVSARAEEAKLTARKRTSGMTNVGVKRIFDLQKKPDQTLLRPPRWARIMHDDTWGCKEKSDPKDQRRRRRDSVLPLPVIWERAGERVQHEQRAPAKHLASANRLPT